jgi:hypothetical protein
VPPETYARDKGPQILLYSFSTRAPFDAEKDKVSLKEKFKTLAKYVEFKFFNDPTANGFHSPKYNDKTGKYEGSEISLARNMVFCLLQSSRMSTSEILVQKFLIAKTVITPPTGQYIWLSGTWLTEYRLSTKSL